MQQNADNTLLKIVLILLLLNLALTAGLYLRQPAPPAAEVQTGFTAAQVLPFAQQIVDAYNRDDPGYLYALYDISAQQKLSRETLEQQLNKLRTTFGQIESIAYLNSVKLGEKGSEKYHQLHFSAKLSNPDLKGAQLVLHIIVDAQDQLRLYGMRLNAGQ